MPRAVFDTNTLLSAFLWSGPEAQALEAVRHKRVQLVVTDALLAEYREVLSRPKFDTAFLRAGFTREAIFDELDVLAEIVAPSDVPTDAVKDPKDVKVLACAVGGKAELIVSGDKRHLLVLGGYAGIEIVTTVELLARLENDAGRERDDDK